MLNRGKLSISEVVILCLSCNYAGVVRTCDEALDSGKIKRFDKKHLVVHTRVSYPIIKANMANYNVVTP